MKVIEEFWYGNINPMERAFQSKRKMRHLTILFASKKNRANHIRPM